MQPYESKKKTFKIWETKLEVVLCSFKKKKESFQFDLYAYITIICRNCPWFEQLFPLRLSFLYSICMHENPDGCVHTAVVTSLAYRRRKLNGPHLHFKPAAPCKCLGPAVILLLSLGAYINPGGLDTSHNNGFMGGEMTWCKTAIWLWRG